MSTVQLAILAAYGIIVLVAFSRHVLLTISIRRTVFLTRTSPKFSDGSGPLVSVLIPAKDEERSIEACARSILAQDYRNLEVLVIDDRSRDRTAEIVERVAREDSRLRLVRIAELPAGWTGKTHALHVGQQQARGQWNLFVDADTRYEPSCLGIVLRDAIDHGVDLESLLPALEVGSFWEGVVQPFAGACLMVFYPLHKVNDPSATQFGFANGQFILVRRSAYAALGGHAAVRDKFVEDIHLGRRARQLGHKLRVVMAPELARVRMYASLPAIIHGWSRILYSAVDFRPAQLYKLLAAISVFSVLSYAMLIGTSGLLVAGMRSTFLFWLFGLAVAHQVFQTTIMARVYALSHSRLGCLLFRILAVGIMLVVVIKTIRMCRTHRVVWRGTSYGKELQTTAT
jgi:glycosyltransferase involved in cell wall biosynthesis